ncbi:MAG: Crp/Fnr family transcriptional regulator, partial [Rhodospirillales bacterium]
GAARVVIFSLSGREITLDDFNAGGNFGDLAAIDGEPRSASVMALRDTVIASLSQERFLQLLSEHFTVTLRLMRALTRIVRTSTDRIMDLSTLAANNRVQADLLRLARNNMVGENRAELKPIPVHGDIASRVSTTRETVARVLSDLSRQGMVERQKDRLVIDDVDRLEDMVEEVRGE